MNVNKHFERVQILFFEWKRGFLTLSVWNIIRPRHPAYDGVNLGILRQWLSRPEYQNNLTVDMREALFNFRGLGLMLSKSLRALAVILIPFMLAINTSSQWRNRYPKVQGFGHHVYLEGYELPTLNTGPSDPAVSPDGRSVAIASRGWLWKMDIATREATRLTRGSNLDSRPAWSPDGKQIAFVRDDTRDTNIHVIDLTNNSEKVLINTPALDLDPAFSNDGRALFYSSAEAGTIDLYRLDLATGEKKRLTTDRELAMRAQPLPGDEQILYLSKRGSADSIVVFNTSDGSRRALREEPIASQMRPALRPDGRSVVVNLPANDGYHLWLIDLRGGPQIRLSYKTRLPLTPTWSPDGSMVYFVEADSDERFHLWRIPVGGGEAEDVSPVLWNWGESVTRITVKTRRAGNTEGLPARLSITDRDGHPVVPDKGQPRFEAQNGRVFVYSPGTLTAEVPAGEVRVTAVHGLACIPATASRKITAGQDATIDIELNSVWNPASDGWYGADLHSHLNYGGPYSLSPEDLILDMQAEQLDVSTPQLANLHTRLNDTQWWGWRKTDKSPMIIFAQEVRSHFLGHVGVIGADSLYWPWFFGPGYPVYDKSDFINADALAFARRQGGINSYVHPVSTLEPFPKDGPPRSIPPELVPDAVMRDVDLLEIVCLWSNSRGTSDLWYRLLNVGVPIAPSGGSDTMHNLYRTMAIGSTRVYAKPEGGLNIRSYIDALRRGRSFVTNGPMIKFNVAGTEAGGIINAAADSTVNWTIDLWSAIPVEKVEVIVNGQIIWSDKGPTAPGNKQYTGTIKVPRGGWVAARAHGGESQWPVLDSYPFAHTGAIWFGQIGSMEPQSALQSASDLLQWLDIAEKNVNQAYADAHVPRLRKRFADARNALTAIQQKYK